ncbi:MAG: hypothetical protein P8Y53_09115 [Pseudolabrys sp.]
MKGAGGRFVRREDRDKPYPQGLKATDPAGAARAAGSCAVAEALGRQAQADAAWLRWNEAFLLWLKTAARLRAALAARQARQSKRRPYGAAGAPDAQPDAYAQWLARAGQAAIGYLAYCRP